MYQTVGLKRKHRNTKVEESVMIDWLLITRKLLVLFISQVKTNIQKLYS